MKKVKKLKVLSFAKFQAILFALIGIVAGVLYSFGGAIYDVFTIGLNFGSVLAFLALIGMPIVFAAFGFIIGIIEAFLYNLISRWIGGFELNFEK